jgi:hypothetical protein
MAGKYEMICGYGTHSGTKLVLLWYFKKLKNMSGNFRMSPGVLPQRLRDLFLN